MNEYSFIGGIYHMSRITESSKIENIKKAAMKLLTEHGFGNTTIAHISKKAGVSQGYLYRHYKSKEELIKDLIETRAKYLRNLLHDILENSKDISEITNKFISTIFDETNANPSYAKFASSIVLNVNLPIAEKLESYKNLRILAEKFVDLGKKTGELNPKVIPDEVLLVYSTIPFRHIILRLDKDENYKFGKEESNRISELCLNALK